MMRTSDKITEAVDSTGRVFAIEHAQPGQVYACLNCEQDLLVKHGPKVRWHYAHRRNADPCVPVALRYLMRAEAAVVGGISRVVNSRTGSYKVGYRCDDCDGLVTTEAADPWTQTSIQARANDAGHSRIFVDLPDRRRLELLLVSGNEVLECSVLEPAPYLVLVRQVESQGDAEELRRVFVGAPHPAVLDSLPDCALCAAGQRYASLASKAERWAEELWRSEGETITPWGADREGRPMYWRVRQRVFSAALIVAQLGFKQTKQKPWLFVQSETPLATLFVDFGASERRVLWRDASAQVYSSMRFQENNDQMLRAIGEAEEIIARRLRDLGANVKSRLNLEVDEVESYRKVEFEELTKLVDAIEDEKRSEE